MKVTIPMDVKAVIIGQRVIITRRAMPQTRRISLPLARARTPTGRHSLLWRACLRFASR